MLKWILKQGFHLDWIHLAHEKNKWRAAVDTLINLDFHKLLVISWLNEKLSVYQEGLWSVERFPISEFRAFVNFRPKWQYFLLWVEIGDVSVKSLRGRWCRLLGCEICNILYLCMYLWAYRDHLSCISNWYSFTAWKHNTHGHTIQNGVTKCPVAPTVDVSQMCYCSANWTVTATRKHSILKLQLWCSGFCIVK